MHEDKNGNRSEGLWAFTPLLDGVEQGRKILLLANLSARGIYLLQERPKHFQLLKEIENDQRTIEGVRWFARRMHEAFTWPMDLNEELEVAEGEAPLARKETENGFVDLYNQSFVSAWGVFESTLEQFLANWVGNAPYVEELDAVREAKHKAKKRSYYAQLDEDERLLETVQRLPWRKDLKGVARYEHVLQIFGLSGDIDEELRQNHSFYDAKPVRLQDTVEQGHYLRDVLVHRRGIIGRKTIAHCPCLRKDGQAVGDRVIFTGMGLEVYVRDLLRYLVLIAERVSKQLGIPMPDEDLSDVYARDWK